MQYRKLGRTGLDVSVIGIGSWVSYDYQIGVAQAKEIIQASYDQGVNFVSFPGHGRRSCPRSDVLHPLSHIKR